jgi:hypothetical protein
LEGAVRSAGANLLFFRDTRINGKTQNLLILAFSKHVRDQARRGAVGYFEMGWFHLSTSRPH